MDELKRQKIKRFLEDEVMSEAVYGIILKTFLKPQKGDVQILAASRIAIDLLDEAWKELSKLKSDEDNEDNIKVQVGL